MRRGNVGGTDDEGQDVKLVLVLHQEIPEHRRDKGDGRRRPDALEIVFREHHRDHGSEKYPHGMGNGAGKEKGRSGKAQIFGDGWFATMCCILYFQYTEFLCLFLHNFVAFASINSVLCIVMR